MINILKKNYISRFKLFIVNKNIVDVLKIFINYDLNYNKNYRLKYQVIINFNNINKIFDLCNTHDQNTDT